ncbi:hypothetical protein [Ramlibacter pallidus]|uniref:Uncharacterized protein n=1 Tax=Ramlibacter pallidus TaxID=2780087 RepID=A0ABR9S8P8_9BURK|nr:hypothetical protein [Ramlibacter pallidus]MBE7369900.1 hypothetical protein [Ramlibacter pallidus]
MKTASILISAAFVFAAAGASAQAQIFRCPGNVYTNSQAEAQSRGCKLMEGGNVTVVQGTRVNGAAATGVANVSAPGSAASREAVRVNSGDQKARDSDARAILEAELKKAETRKAELLKEYNNGEPDKLGPETRNHQKYLDRVAELKASIERTDNDIKGLQRELGRTGGSTASK